MMEWRREFFRILSSILNCVAASHKFIKQIIKTVAWDVSPRHGGTHVAPQWQPHMWFLLGPFCGSKQQKVAIATFCG